VAKSAFTQAFEDSAAADIAAFSDGEGTYTTPAGVATSGVPYVIDPDSLDEEQGNRGTAEAQRATIEIATDDVAAPAIGGKFTDEGSVLWAIKAVTIEAGVATLGVVRTGDVEISAEGHRMEAGA